jgi:hypothetical protein
MEGWHRLRRSRRPGDAEWAAHRAERLSEEHKFFPDYDNEASWERRHNSPVLKVPDLGGGIYYIVNYGVPSDGRGYRQEYANYRSGDTDTG